MAKDVILALDFPGEAETLGFLDRFGSSRPYVKVGMELFYAAPQLVGLLKGRGHKIFLDLKLHDIPNTVKGGMASVAAMGADMVNLHASGGRKMMEAAIEGLSSRGGERPILIAVTQLTSTSADTLKNELLIDRPMEEVVISYAKNAAAAGLDGVVCSPLEAAGVKKACGDRFLTITPGIRFADSSTDDQSRIATPSNAAGMGCDYLVVGRPITKSEDPKAAYDRCIREFLGGTR